MTTDVPVTADRTGLDPEELRANLRQADAGVLVAVLAQLTGDPAAVDRFADKIFFEPDPPEQVGLTDPETRERLVDAVAAALGAPRPQAALPVDDPSLFARIARLRSAPR